MFHDLDHARAILHYITRIICNKICYVQAHDLEFHPKGISKSKNSMWVEFPFLKLDFCPFLQYITSQQGRVLWCKQHTNKWEILCV